jgi:hypothetical protein
MRTTSPKSERQSLYIGNLTRCQPQASNVRFETTGSGRSPAVPGRLAPSALPSSPSPSNPIPGAQRRMRIEWSSPTPKTLSSVKCRKPSNPTTAMIQPATSPAIRIRGAQRRTRNNSPTASVEGPPATQSRLRPTAAIWHLGCGCWVQSCNDALRQSAIRVSEMKGSQIS